ncbi:hypothetical protein [Deinococcus sp. 6GRE01]|uniref:hypothetical protein n=1 Tax=Deinococcus sp. 6GRE01 TaxID=2745873 RepID=UPI001E43E8B5|nr:hypothetical protein [Deinococcus sp. 6GRE01]
MGEGLRHLSLQRLELSEGAAVQALPFDALGTVAHDRDPVGGRGGFHRDGRLRWLLCGRGLAERGDLTLQAGAFAGQAVLFLPVEAGGAQHGRGGLSLGGLLPGREALQRVPLRFQTGERRRLW